MERTKPSLPNFLIAGTEKAGTTSVFVYLSQHPDVCASSRKETDFFRLEYTGDRPRDEAAYSRYFQSCGQFGGIIMEASPGYLGEAITVAPRISSLLPEAKLLFILRDPVERLYSSYNFYIGKLNIPSELSFEDFVEKCIAYDKGYAQPVELGLGEWYLKTLAFGRYAENIELFLDRFPRSNVKVMFYESLRDDAVAFMKELSNFLAIDPQYWDNFEFRKSNVTFSGRNKLLHRLAIALNNASEPLLRKRPRLKHALVDFYKSVNMARARSEPIPEMLREQLANLYRDSNQRLAGLLNAELPDSWRRYARK